MNTAMKTVVVAMGTLVLALLGTGCASATGAVPKPFPMPNRPSAPPAPVPAGIGVASPSPDSLTPGVEAYALVSTALQLRGTPYRNGGGDPFGFDCSGFTQYVFALHHIALPRGVRDQFRAGRAVDLNDLTPGDLLFFSTIEPGASHVAIAIGSDEFVHAPSSAGVVRVEHLSSSYWSQRYLGARRVVTQP